MVSSSGSLLLRDPCFPYLSAPPDSPWSKVADAAPAIISLFQTVEKVREGNAE